MFIIREIQKYRRFYKLLTIRYLRLGVFARNKNKPKLIYWTNKKNQQLISLVSGIGLLLIIVVAIGLYRRNKFINKAKLLVENEKQRSDLLLLNILPEETAKELKWHYLTNQHKISISKTWLFLTHSGRTSYSPGDLAW